MKPVSVGVRSSEGRWLQNHAALQSRPRQCQGAAEGKRQLSRPLCKRPWCGYLLPF